MSKFYNDTTTELFTDAKLIGGNPSGIINFSQTPHKWALSIYRLMESYTWYPEECGLANDKVAYQALSGKQQYAYDLALAQLIANDSIQAKQLPEGIAPYITSPIVSACLVRQSYEETNHSRTYTLGAEEVCADVDRIYTMHLHDKALARKNRAVENMYNRVSKVGATPTISELQVAFSANQILEELVFQVGFITLWSFNFKGTSKAISLIEKDETGTHVPLFKNIFRASVKENGITTATTTAIVIMLQHMVNEEKVWARHITAGLLGFSETALDMYIEFRANSICQNLYLPLMFSQTDGGPLMELYVRNSMLSKVDTKTNFFETTVGDYSVNSLDEDY